MDTKTTDQQTDRAPETTTADTPVIPAVDATYVPDRPGHDDNKDGIAGGKATADVPGDVLGI